ncbi:MAG: hypothetical protein SWE60_09665 [Thermodesulfobacteriota bacterium]|nr:hypothetical protein [Thermodesulfobacteriota bacterium]
MTSPIFVPLGVGTCTDVFVVEESIRKWERMIAMFKCLVLSGVFIALTLGVCQAAP